MCSEACAATPHLLLSVPVCLLLSHLCHELVPLLCQVRHLGRQAIIAPTQLHHLRGVGMWVCIERVSASKPLHWRRSPVVESGNTEEAVCEWCVAHATEE